VVAPGVGPQRARGFSGRQPESPVRIV
jgi:hypothetical protein